MDIMAMNEPESQIISEKDHKLSWNDLGYILLLLFVIFIANYRLIFFKETYQILGDFRYDFVAFLGYNMHGWTEILYKNSCIPVWFSYDAFGVPCIAVHLNGLLHPTGPSLLPLLPYPEITIVMVILHYSLLGIFSYLAFRQLGVSSLAAFFASTWMTLAGYTLRVSYLWMDMNALIGFFFCLWVLIGFFKKVTLGRFILLAIGGCLQILSGDIELNIYFIYFIALWLFIYGIYSVSSGSEYIKILAIIAIAVLPALLISAAQVLPSSFFFTHCMRSERISLVQYKASFHPPIEILIGNLLMILRKLPNIFFGITPLGFCLFGLLRFNGKIISRRSPAIRASSIVIFVLIVIIYLAPQGIYRILYYLPLLSLFFRQFELFSILLLNLEQVKFTLSKIKKEIPYQIVRFDAGTRKRYCILFRN